MCAGIFIGQIVAYLANEIHTQSAKIIIILCDILSGQFHHCYLKQHS